MESTVNTPLSAKEVESNAFASMEQQVDEHLPLLHKIAMSLGVYDQELQAFIKEACCITIKRKGGQEALPLRLLLSKNLVHLCVFSISKRMFQQRRKPAHEIPFSFWVAHQLKTIAGFNEKELAYLLNTTLANIQTRLGRALIFLRH